MTLVVTLGLAACGSNILPPAAGMSSDVSAAGSAYPSVAAKLREEPPQPFADPSEKSATARDVIEKPTLADERRNISPGIFDSLMRTAAIMMR